MEELENKLIAVEVEPQYKNCKFCGQQLDDSMSFCTRCGKYQEEALNTEEIKKRIIKRVKPKKIKTRRVFSYLSFGVSAFVMLYALIRMWLFNIATYSIFGTSYDGILINQTVVLGSLIISMMFLIFGIFLYNIRD